MPNRYNTNIAYIGIGSNLGDSMQNINDAIVTMSQNPYIYILQKSHFYQTAPIDADGNDYINAVVCLKTKYPSLELLKFLQYIEGQFGRERNYINAPRVLDLDLLMYAQEIYTSDILTIPHPRITQRAFVLVPLLDLDKDISIPSKGKAIEYLNRIQKQAIKKVKVNTYANCAYCVGYSS